MNRFEVAADIYEGMDTLQNIARGLTGSPGYEGFGNPITAYGAIADVADNLVTLAKKIRETFTENEGRWDDDGFSN